MLAQYLRRVLKLALPVMRASAGLHAGQTRRQVNEECCHLVSAQLLLHKYLAVLVDSVDLKHVLSQVDTNSRKLHGGRPFSVQVVDKRLHFCTSMPLWVGAFIPLLTTSYWNPTPTIYLRNANRGLPAAIVRSRDNGAELLTSVTSLA